MFVPFEDKGYSFKTEGEEIMYVLETDRLRLREMNFSDVPHLMRYSPIL